MGETEGETGPFSDGVEGILSKSLIQFSVDGWSSDPSLLFTWVQTMVESGFAGGSDGKVSACSAGDPGLIPGLGRSPGEGNGYPLQDSCLENPMDRGAWGCYSPWGHTESDTTERLTHTQVILLSPETNPAL